MKSVVITGSTKGIGLGMAREFLKKECCVVMSGRSVLKIEQEVQDLGRQFGSDRIIARSCDVTDINQVRALWDAGKKAFDRVDIWINNAGVDTTMLPLWELDAAEIAPAISTNITGLIYGCQVALQGMLDQGSGQIYNMLGFGSGDMMRPGMTVYGTSKRAVKYFTDSLIEEAKGTPVQIGTLGPGMVVTDFMIEGMRKMSPEQREDVKTIYNMLADTVETVTPFLTENILNNDQTGAEIDWLTTEKAHARFEDEAYLSRDLFSKYGL